MIIWFKYMIIWFKYMIIWFKYMIIWFKYVMKYVKYEEIILYYTICWLCNELHKIYAVILYIYRYGFHSAMKYVKYMIK